MGNHCRLLLKTIDDSLSVGMRHISGVYTQHFNRIHHQVGHVFQGRFKSIRIDRDIYLFELCRHIVLDPARVGMVERPEVYTWSSCRAPAGLPLRPALLHPAWIPARFSGETGEARRRQMEFVRAG
ncbi:MAG: hypothetical protein ABFD97_10265 [Syntrophobacter sp.]